MPKIKKKKNILKPSLLIGWIIHVAVMWLARVKMMTHSSLAAGWNWIFMLQFCWDKILPIVRAFYFSNSVTLVSNLWYLDYYVNYWLLLLPSDLILSVYPGRLCPNLPGNLTAGTWLGPDSGWRYGDEVTLWCDVGFEPVPETSVMCGEEGEWLDQGLHCQGTYSGLALGLSH